MTFDLSGNVTANSMKLALDQVFGASEPYKGDVGKASVTQFQMGEGQFKNMSIWLDQEIKNINDGVTKYSLTDH